MTTPNTPEGKDEALLPCPFCGAVPTRTPTNWWGIQHGHDCFVAFFAQRRQFIRPEDAQMWNSRASVAAVEVNRLFEAKLLGFGEDDRIRLCEPCVRRAIDDNFVIFACALPLDATPSPAPETEPQALRDENKRLHEHVADLKHDLEAAVKECDEHHE